MQMEGVLKKRVATVGHTVEWKDRFVTMTDDKLYIRNEPNGRIGDTVALLDITQVKTMVDSSKEEGRTLPQTGSHGSLRSLSLSQLYGTSTGEKRTLSHTGSSGSLRSLSSNGTGNSCQKVGVDSALGWARQAAPFELSVDPIQTHLAGTTEHSPLGQTKVSTKKDSEQDWTPVARRDTSETVDILQGKQSAGGVRLEGHVRKRGRINKAFKDRFFVLTDDMLSYYKTQDTKHQARGGMKCIDIETVQASTASMQGTYEFTVTDTNGRSLVCSVPTEESQQAWIQEIYAATVDSSALDRSLSRPSREPTSPHTASLKRRNAIRPEATQATHSSDFYRSEWSNVLKIYAERYGRTYYLRASSSQDTEKWLDALQTAIQEAWVRHERDLNLSFHERFQISARKVYNRTSTQMAISMLLLLNFAISISQSELDAQHPLQAYFETANVVFTFIYTVELVVNLYAHWFWEFVNSGWSWFDLIIVLMSLVDTTYVLTAKEGTGTGLSVVRTMRLLRVFRIVRIFHMLEYMRRTITALANSVGLICNAFLLFIVIICIYSVLGVNLLKSYPLTGDPFTSFSSSFYILLGIAYGAHDWTVYLSASDQDHDPGAIIVTFFLSFIALVGIIAFNIIVAVMLQGFASSMSQADTNERMLKEAQTQQEHAGALDPFLAVLANFHSPQHLKCQLDLIFGLWDVDENASLSQDEMRYGLCKLGFNPISTEDWEEFTLHGLLADEEGEVSREQFDLAMRFQLSEYSQRILANKMQLCIKTDHELAPILFPMKMACLEIMTTALERRQASLSSTQTPPVTSHPTPQTFKVRVKEAEGAGEGGGGGGGGGGEGSHRSLSGTSPANVESRLDRMEALLYSLHDIIMARGGGGGGGGGEQEPVAEGGRGAEGNREERTSPAAQYQEPTTTSCDKEGGGGGGGVTY